LAEQTGAAQEVAGVPHGARFETFAFFDVDHGMRETYQVFGDSLDGDVAEIANRPRNGEDPDVHGRRIEPIECGGGGGVSVAFFLHFLDHRFDVRV
jgi:hypothetical protein